MAVLQGDAYKGYDRRVEPQKGEVKNLLAGCLMHARRPFVRALEAGDPLASFFIDRFQAIYRLERTAKVQALTAGQRLELRQAQSRPLFEQIRARVDELRPLPVARPLREGITYIDNQWERLLVPFERDGRLEIDNGPAERRLRCIASGRKAWLFAGSHRGAARFADMLSLVSSADAAGHDPGSYLTDVFKRLADGCPNDRLPELLPHRWSALQ
jgi:hypothetical protein